MSSPWRLAVRLALGCALVAGSALAGPPAPRTAPASPGVPEGPGPLAVRVLEGVQLRLGRLSTLAGQARFSYSGGPGQARTRDAAFAFRKPFELVVDELTGSFRLLVSAGRIELFFPREKEVLSFSLGDPGAGSMRDLVEMFAIEHFAVGFGLAELRSHFDLGVRQRERDWRVDITARPDGIWRRSLGLTRIAFTVERPGFVPQRIDVHVRDRLDRPERLAFSMTLVTLSMNEPVPASRFRIAVPPGARQLGLMDLLGVLASPALDEGKRALRTLGSDLGERLKRFRDRPWDF